MYVYEDVCIDRLPLNEMSGVDRILWIYVQRSYLGTTDVAIGGDNGLYLPGEKQDQRVMIYDILIVN